MTDKVYFVSAPGRIKVGFTRKPEARLQQLRRMDMEEITVISVIDGSRTVEKELLKRLGAFQLRGEWFRDCNETRAIINDAIENGVSIAKADASAVAGPAQAKNVSVAMNAIEESKRLANEIQFRAERGEPISDLVRMAFFLAEKVIAPELNGQ